jgi:PAS domain S-box-containing protein
MSALPSILLIEDHAATRQQVQHALTAAGFTVHEARDGKSALAMMEQHRPPLVIQDLGLPDMDGFALAHRLRKLAGAGPLRLIAFSGLISDHDAGRMTAAGFDDVLPKPALPSRVVELARSHAAQQASTERVSPQEAELMRRCSSLTAELAVMRSLTDAVLRDGDIESALVGAIASCIDASNSVFGVLYLCDGNVRMRASVIGGERHVDVRDVPTFFGREAWLRASMRSGQTVVLELGGEGADVLERAKVQHAVLVPLTHGGKPRGALFVATQRDEPASERDARRAFVEHIAVQLGEALAVAESYRSRQLAEREAEQQRRFARDQAAVWRALVDCAPDVLMHLDEQGRVRFINRTPEGVAGASSERAQSLSWFELCDERHHPAMRDALADVFALGASRTLETSRRSNDCATWTESHLGPVRNGADVTGALVIERDVSAKKQAEAQLVAVDRMASIGSLAAAIAHEVNNPLASVMANLELAVHEAEQIGTRLPAELMDELYDAREAASRVRSIVRDLRVFSRSDDDVFGPVDLARVLDSTLRLAWNEVRQRASLERSFSAVGRVYGSESRLGQVLLNLLLQVVHQIEEGHADRNTIGVRLFTDDLGRVVIELREQVRDRVAESPNGNAASQALCFSICNRVLGEHGGNLESTHTDDGRLLRVTMPACEEAVAEQLEESAVLPRISEIHARRRGRVLVIDDERLIAQVVRRTLSREHEVVTLDNAEEGLLRLEAGEHFDAIVCDLMMPRMSGMEFHRRVAADYPELAERIVFFTGGAFTPRAREFLARVPNQRVEKPVAGYELRSVINGIVR